MSVKSSISPYGKKPEYVKVDFDELMEEDRHRNLEGSYWMWNGSPRI